MPIAIGEKDVLRMLDVQPWLEQRRNREKWYEEADQSIQQQIDDWVDRTLTPFRETLEPEVRENNGVARAIDRERRRLRTEAVARLLNYDKTSLPRCGVENADGRHPGMVFIPPGEVLLGVDRGFASREEPQQATYVDGFWIDVIPVTNYQFHQLYPTHKPDPHSADPTAPVVNVTWFDAAKFCGALGKRLPTQQEWERAARGPYGWLYSFGERFDRSLANVWPSNGAVPGLAYLPNPFGVHQMCGNVWEWTAEVFAHELAPGRRVFFNLARGGSWRHCEWGARATMSLVLDLGQRSDNVGFRCVSSY